MIQEYGRVFNSDCDESAVKHAIDDAARVLPKEYVINVLNREGKQGQYAWYSVHPQTILPHSYGHGTRLVKQVRIHD